MFVILEESGVFCSHQSVLCTCSEDLLWSHFSQFGSMNGVEIIKDKPTGKSRGFGFVDFNEASAAESALRASHTIGGRRCDVKLAVPKVRIRYSSS